MRLLLRLAVLGLVAVTAGALAAALLATGAEAPGRGRTVPGASTSPVAATTAARTTVHRVSPLDAAGHLRSRYDVGVTGRGFCWTSSFVNGHLYRCFRGNLVMDPCWKETGRHSVVCLTRPWASTVVRLRLTKHLPARDSFGPSLWGLRLGGGIGVGCLVAMGASGTVGGHPISYVCRGGWVLLGNGPHRNRPLWTMATARWVSDHYELRGRKPLTSAWRAVAAR